MFNDCIITNIAIFCYNGSSIIWSYLPHFQVQARKKKKKKNPLLKNFSYFREWNFLAPKLKIFWYFMKWNFLALILRNFLCFLKKSFSYILGNETVLYFRKWKPIKNSLCFRKRNFFIFQETETSKNYFYFRKQNSLIFQKEFPKLQNWNLLYFSKKCYE